MKILFVLSMFILFAGVPAFSDSITFKGGYVRPTGDNDLLDLSRRPNTLSKDKLDGLTGEISYEHFLGENFSIGGNVGYYNSDTRISELDLGFQSNRDVELRIIPVEFAVQYLPAGRQNVVNPYVGGGVGAYFWKYREAGNFVVDPSDPTPTVVPGLVTADNTDFGWHVEGGLRFPISHAISILGEAKYFRVEGDLGGSKNELDDLFGSSRPKVKLSQMTFTGGVAFTF